jgi:hypothetical protein
MLQIVLLYTNMTAPVEVSGSGNRNIIISIVVIAMTIIISAAMIAIILILRYKDKQEKKQNQKPLTFPQIVPQEKVTMNGVHRDQDMQIKKKKEVSFSIDEDLENMELCNTMSTTNSVFNDFEVCNVPKHVQVNSSLFIYFKMDNFKMKLDPSNTNVA